MKKIVAAALIVGAGFIYSAVGIGRANVVFTGASPLPETAIAGVVVNRAAAAGIMMRVRAASAHYMPLRGGVVPRIEIGGRRSQSSSPYDLTFYGGPTVRTESAYDLYVNCRSFNACWGAPGSFLGSLASTNFVHLLDQYTGSTSNNRYTYAGGISASYNTSGTLQDQDIYNLVHAAASKHGTGYGHIYHVFLPAGVAQCSQSAGGCYAQQYCAYHGAIDFADIGHTLYSVEPYQGINGCMSPNGKLNDSTDSTLSHEMFETITDPDVQTNAAWYNNSFGEIGDICRNSAGYTTVGGGSLDIQREYSNRYHACSFAP